MVLCLAVILGAVFFRSCSPNTVVFSNDGPYGVQKTSSLALPGAFEGTWYFSWIGCSGGCVYVDPTHLFRWLVGPEGFAKFYYQFSLLLLGTCAWAFFRTLGLRPMLCLLGAIAAALNGNYFSNTCWGLGSRAITLGFIFLALAALNARRLGNRWLNAILAGLAVGLAVVEGADNGAILSLFVAAFVIYQSFIQGRSLGCRLVRSTRLVLVAVLALFMAAQALVGLIGLAGRGAASTQDSQETAEGKWAFATQWSLPPVETLRVIIPGLFGNRLDAPDNDVSKAYWGRVGEHPLAPEQMRRFNGSGEYAGVLVVLLAIWAIAASFSRQLGTFDAGERKMIWFWTFVLAISIPLAWGRFAPLYKLFYALPYFSSIRNPMKFMHVTHMALMVLFAYGLLGLDRRYLDKPLTAGSWLAQVKSWRTRALPFERRWIWGTGVVSVLSVLAWLIYGSSRTRLLEHIMSVGYPNSKLAGMMAGYSISEVGFYVGFLGLSLGVLWLVMGGVFAGKRSPWAAVLLGLVLTADLARADLPWIRYWDLQKKYASNPVIDIFRDKPYESRMTMAPFLFNTRALGEAGQFTHIFPQLYTVEWAQHQFPCFDIHYMDAAQDPRPPADKGAYNDALLNDPDRYWELTSTRYVLGMTGFLDALNQRLDRGRNRFRIRATFDVAIKPGMQLQSAEDLTVVLQTNGPLAVFEFAGALPRASLYSHWQVMTNDESTLKTLGDPAFDPHATVLVADEIPAATTDDNAGAGTVEFAGYTPRRVELKADVQKPSVLLLNDHFDPDWQVTVDGQPAKVLRCNFIMRGVLLSPGQHTVVYTFKLPLKWMKVSLAASVLGVVLCVLLAFVRHDDHPPDQRQK